MSDRTRCPNCGALVAADAAWCGQCYAALRDPEPVETQAAGAAPPAPRAAFTPAPDGHGPSVPVEPPPIPIRRVGEALVWACPSCERENPMEASACAACGTPFTAVLGREADRERPRVEPRAAAVRSLLLPGLGHFAVGRGADGVARLVLFLWALGLAVMMLLSRGNAAVVGVGAVFAFAAVALWALTALDAARLARDDEQVLTPRVLLVGTIGLTVLSIGAFVAAGTLPA